MPTIAKPSRTAAEFPGQARGREAKRSKRRTVDQAEGHERETDRADPGRAAREAADDRDPDHLVEPPGKDDPHDRRAPAGGRESHRPGPLARGEEPSPAARFDEERDEEEERHCGEQRRPALREGHRRIAHVQGGQGHQQKADRGRGDGADQARAFR